MNTTALAWLCMGLLVGVALGGLLGWLVTARQARTRETGLQAELQAARDQASSREEALRAELRAAQDKASYLDERLDERFRALSAEALAQNNQQFLDLAHSKLAEAGKSATSELDQRKQAIEHLVTPLREAVTKVERQLRELDSGQRAAHAELTKHVDFVRESSEHLRSQTAALVTALRRPEARGRWGEVQLRRVVELAGMSNHCDFDEQITVTTAEGPQRPDMVVHLAGDKHVVVDSKVSLSAYLEAAEETDEDQRTQRLDAHAKHLRAHVDKLAAKSYWSSLTPAPEFVIAFIPGEAFLAPALDRDPELLEYAMGKRVHIATPTTLITMLRTAQYAWQQAALSENARAVFDLGKELYERLGSMGRRMDGLGKALSNAVSAYNRTVGSLEDRVMVTARKLNTLELVDAELTPPRPVEETTRSLSASELLDNVAEDGRDRVAENGQGRLLHEEGPASAADSPETDDAHDNRRATGR